MTDQKFKAFLTAWDLKKNEAANAIFSGEDKEEFPTIFPENIMQTPDEIAQMVLASGQNFEKVVTFSPEQELFYETITRAMVYSKWDALEAIQAPVLEIFQQAKEAPEFAELEVKLAKQRAGTEQIVRTFLQDGTVPENSELAAQLQNHSDHIHATLNKLDVDAVPERLQEGFQTGKDDIVANYITAKIFNAYQQQMIADFVQPFLEKAFDDGQLERATLYASDAPEIAHFILTGPPAVGKSSSLQQMKDLCEEKGCKWEETLKMSGDERRDFFIAVYENMHHAIMDPEQVAPDGRVIKDKVWQTLSHLLEQGKSRPLYHDEATAIRSMKFVELALQGNTPLYVVQKDLAPEVSIARSFKRYEETKRPNATSEIYRKHQKFPALIENFLKQVDGYNVHYALRDAEAPLGQPSPTILEIDASNGVCTIHDLKKAFAFQHKANIADVNAKPSPDCTNWEELTADLSKKLYPQDKRDPLTTMEWLDTFCDRYQVDFADKDSKKVVFSISEKGKRVRIHDKELFAKKMEEDVAFRRIIDQKFPSLSKMHERDSEQNEISAKFRR